MKSGERNAIIRRVYDSMEHDRDARAEWRFRHPAALTGKLTKIAAVKIIERDIEALDDVDSADLERMARKCMDWRKHKENTGR